MLGGVHKCQKYSLSHIPFKALANLIDKKPNTNTNKGHANMYPKGTS